MKIKVSEATGPVLDWLVAKCEDHNVTVTDDGCYCWFTPTSCSVFNPSTNWAQGGPLLNHPTIGVVAQVADSDRFCAYRVNGKAKHYYYADELLWAICKAFVASKLGDEVEVLEELT